MTRIIAGRWSLVAGRWSLVAGRWSLVAGRWSLVVRSWQLARDQRPVASNHERLTSRMILLMHLPQILTIDVRINLRCRNVRMAEHFLHGAQIGAAFQKMRCERMTKRMRRHGL